MKIEPILKIWIDKSNRLCIQSTETTFELIYRSTMGVQWNNEHLFMYSQIMGSWSPVDWFNQMLRAVEVEYGLCLFITEKTEWENIDESFKELIKAESENHHAVRPTI